MYRFPPGPSALIGYSDNSRVSPNNAYCRQGHGDDRNGRLARQQKRGRMRKSAHYEYPEITCSALAHAARGKFEIFKVRVL